VKFIYNLYLVFQIFNVYSSRSEVFANLPLTVSSLKDDVQSGAVEQWFTSSELASLDIRNDSDLAFISELYLIQRVVNTVSFSLMNLHPVCKFFLNSE
jgi:hypothetical protein